MHITIVGTGRAGSSFARALTQRGQLVELRHHDDTSSWSPTDVVLLCVPDDHLAEVAATVPASDAVVAHCAGSRTLAVLGDHWRRGSIHPLVALPETDVGARRLVGATFAVAGDERLLTLVDVLEGRAVVVNDADRARYHAAACVAANHVVVLLDQVANLASSLEMALEDFLPLTAMALDDVTRRGPVDALTGPASRGDLATIDAHLAALPEAERPLYVALARAALAVAERRRAGTH
jgi:predicted short-subunit dehydrogenase-like oxidoreductase (DUF2520 family)